MEGEAVLFPLKGLIQRQSTVYLRCNRPAAWEAVRFWKGEKICKVLGRPALCAVHPLQYWNAAYVVIMEMAHQHDIYLGYTELPFESI